MTIATTNLVTAAADLERGRVDGLALDREDVAGGHLLQVPVRLGVQVDHV